MPVPTSSPAVPARNEIPGGATRSAVDVSRAGSRLALKGRLDVTTASEVRTCLHRAVDAGSDATDLVVDLSGLEVLDATGLGVLVGTHRRAGRLGRRLVLVGVPERVVRVLVATRLHRVLVVAASDRVA